MAGPTPGQYEKGLLQPSPYPNANSRARMPSDPTGKAAKDSYKPEPIVVPLPAKH